MERKSGNGRVLKTIQRAIEDLEALTQVDPTVREAIEHLILRLLAARDAAPPSDEEIRMEIRARNMA